MCSVRAHEQMCAYTAGVIKKNHLRDEISVWNQRDLASAPAAPRDLDQDCEALQLVKNSFGVKKNGK